MSTVNQSRQLTEAYENAIKLKESQFMAVNRRTRLEEVYSTSRMFDYLVENFLNL